MSDLRLNVIHVTPTDPTAVTSHCSEFNRSRKVLRRDNVEDAIIELQLKGA